MILENKFFVSQFDLVWKSRIIARLRYEKSLPMTPEEGEQTLNDINSLLASPTLDVRTSSSSNSTQELLASTGATFESLEIQPSYHIPLNSTLTLNLKYLAGAQDIPIWAIFMTIFATLKDNAQYPASARVQPLPLSFSADGFNAILQIQRIDGPAHTRPPFLERQDINHMLTLLPKFMFRHGKFKEVEFRIGLDGKE